MARPFLVLDLDDTLYLERDFAHSGFRAVGDWLKAETGIGGFAASCAALFADGQRTGIFDTALRSLGRDDPALVDRLVAIYRGHEPTIALAPDARRYLEERRAADRFAIITDGASATQMAKVRALGVERHVETVIYTDLWGRDYWKPHRRAFEAIEAMTGLSGSALLYVADNPTKDFIAPRALGWHTIMIARPERVHRVTASDPSHEAHHLIESFDQLDERLADLG
jgi:putative hydrolase of the HAD superfamily